jgi:hypothetical protein
MMDSRLVEGHQRCADDGQRAFCRPACRISAVGFVAGIRRGSPGHHLTVTTGNFLAFRLAISQLKRIRHLTCPPSHCGHQITADRSPQFKERAQALRLMCLLAHWDAVQGDPARIA